MGRVTDLTVEWLPGYMQESKAAEYLEQRKWRHRRYLAMWFLWSLCDAILVAEILVIMSGIFS